MSAIRLARGFTGRDLTVKFEGCYHGHVDSLLVKAGSGVATLGLPDTAGVPKSFRDTTIALPYNSADAVEEAFRTHGERIAAVIVEPVVGNMGCVPPAPGFLEALRDDDQPPRRAADLRRGDDGLPRGLRRRAAAVRHPARSDHAGKSDRRRLAGGRLWRPQGHYEPGGAGRAGLPGGHAFRQSAGGGRRPGHAAAPESASGNLPIDWRRAPPSCAPPRRPASR